MVYPDAAEQTIVVLAKDHFINAPPDEDTPLRIQQSRPTDKLWKLQWNLFPIQLLVRRLSKSEKYTRSKRMMMLSTRSMKS